MVTQTSPWNPAGEAARGRASGTVGQIGEDRGLPSRVDSEPAPFEKPGLAGHGEKLPDPALPPPLAALFDQPACNPCSAKVGMDGEAANLGEPPRVDLKGAASDNPAPMLSHEEGRNAGKVGLDQLVREEGDQSANPGHLPAAGRPDGHLARQSRLPVRDGPSPRIAPPGRVGAGSLARRLQFEFVSSCAATQPPRRGLRAR